MRKFGQGTCAKVIETGRIGVVHSRERCKVSLGFYDQNMVEPETYTYVDYQLEGVDFPKVRMSQLKELVRGKITVGDITLGTNILPDYIEEDANAYRITAGDLLAGLNVYEGKPPEYVYPWLEALHLYEEDISFTSNPWENIRDSVKEKDILNLAYDEVESLRWRILDDKPSELSNDDFKPLREALEIWT